jgi:tetratricopeptide (TPR) repeat protein
VKEILAKDSNYVPALMVSALLAERTGASDHAAQTYQKVLSIYPLFAPAMRELAIVYSRHPGDQDQAYAWAQKARATLPDDLELAKILGVLAYHRADYDKSKRYLKEYTAKSDEDGEAFYYLGVDCFELKQTNACRQALTNALSLHVDKTLADNAEGILKQLK